MSTRISKTSVREALEKLNPLVGGKLSLVETVTADGPQFYVAVQSSMTTGNVILPVTEPLPTKEAYSALCWAYDLLLEANRGKSS